MARIYPDMKLYLGSEVYREPEIMEQVVELMDSGLSPTTNGTKYVLMELSQWVFPENSIPCAETLVIVGYKLIITHKERYKHLWGNMEWG